MKASSQSPDPTLALLARWRAGDRSALNELLAEVLPWLHSEMSRAIGRGPRDSMDSMDVVQIAVTNFLSSGPRFVPNSTTQLRALLKRIATNELIDYRRRLGRAQDQRHVESIVGASNSLSGFGGASHSTGRPSKVMEKEEDVAWVRLALQFLSEEDRYLLLASEVEGLDWATIARELQLASPDTARMRCTRLKPRVANLMRQLRSGRLPEE